MQPWDLRESNQLRGPERVQPLRCWFLLRGRRVERVGDMRRRPLLPDGVFFGEGEPVPCRDVQQHRRTLRCGPLPPLPGGVLLPGRKQCGDGLPCGDFLSAKQHAGCGSWCLSAVPELPGGFSVPSGEQLTHSVRCRHILRHGILHLHGLQGGPLLPYRGDQCDYHARQQVPRRPPLPGRPVERPRRSQ